MADLSETKWTPPFCSTDTELTCPACGEEGSVCVREQETYYDASDYEGYCCECHVELRVWATVEIAFCEAELANEDEAASHRVGEEGGTKR